MMKTLLTAILFFTVVGSSHSQTFQVIVKGGAALTDLSGDFNEDGLKGFYAGIGADLGISERFHIQPEFLYSQEGAEGSRLNYLRIPLMLKIYVLRGLNVQAGPEYAIKLGGDSGADEQTTDNDFGLGFGAGYEMPFGLFADVRYNHGLTDISNMQNFTIYNRGIQFGLGFKF